MAEKLRLRTNANGDIYFYAEHASGASMAIGSDITNNTFAINASASADVEPDATTASVLIGPGANADLLLRPHGTGKSEFNTGNVQITAGSLYMPGTSNDGTNGCIFTNNSYDGNQRTVSFPDDYNVYIGTQVGTFPNVPSVVYNTVIGSNALGESSFGALTGGAIHNIGIGKQVFHSLVGNALSPSANNIAFGNHTLYNITQAGNNIAVGSGALGSITTGGNNQAIGVAAGSSLTGSNSSNICIGNTGTAGDNNTIRIGTQGAGAGQQNRAFMAGIHGVTPSGVSQQVMIMDSSGQIGTTSGGSFVTNSYATESGTATPAAGVITLTGGNNIGTSGAGSTVTFVVDNIVGQTNGGASIVPFVATATGNIAQTPGGAVTMNTGTQSLSISSDASATTVSIATGAAVKTTTLGSTNSTSATTVQSGSGALALTSTNGTWTGNSGTGALGLSTDASATTVSLATGAAVKTVTLGSTNSTSTTTVQSGSGALNVTSTNGAMTLNSGTGTIGLSTDASATTVNLATGAAAKTVTLGSTNTTSSLALKYGTADFSLASATGNVMVALDTGEITYPLQSSFLAYRSADVANVTGDGTIYTCTFDTEVFDRNADYNNGTYTFTAPVTGLYQFNVNVGAGSLGAAHTIGLVQIVTTGRTFNSNYSSWGVARASNNIYMYETSVLTTMTAGDTATTNFQVYNSTKTVTFYGGAVNSWWSGNLVA